MDYRVLVSSNGEGAYLITNEMNLEHSLKTLRHTHLGDRFELMGTARRPAFSTRFPRASWWTHSCPRSASICTTR